MTHETTAPVTGLVDEVLAELDHAEKTHLDGEVRDMAREAYRLIRQQQAELAQQAAPVAVPDGYQMVPKKISPEMIESALGAHYGARRVRQAGGAIGVDMTANGINYSGIHAMRRMWAGALAVAQTPPAGAWESPSTPPAQKPVAWMPYLSDRADGVKGHYAIARHNPAGYREVWNLHRHKWAAFSDDILTLEQALELMRQVAIPTASPAQQSDLKRLCTSFYYWWSNRKGMNTEQGFDDWFEREGRAMLGDTVAPEQAEQDSVRVPRELLERAVDQWAFTGTLASYPRAQAAYNELRALLGGDA
ncbi:hypothetical protein SAMN04244572_03212 [Azotobacter beijerinckii]|uniref:Uncharacterized protein n=1 Tax=Azotobacter beijerinckii TaxID=170623 RepID=A0A1H6XFU7_9GAMM|nr:hypothetical protein [Azotobacter beijerinckii]SEJ23455.1 hypothetical protein SAMN04244572_03212 [Azotobacter beijerinckii]